MKTHTLKTDAEIYDRVATGEKLFDIRKDDRHFQTGDKVILNSVSSAGAFPAAPFMPTMNNIDRTKGLKFTIGFVLRGGQYGIEPGYVAFSLLPSEVK